MRHLLMLLMLAPLAFSQPFLLVMDASGSMDELMPDGHGAYTTRMDVAKESAKGFIDRSGSEIGLMLFDNCDTYGDVHSGGIRLVQDFTYDKAALKSEVEAIEPYGSTPIAHALDEAKKHILVTRGSGTIVLITDGEETCSGDPVQMASEAKASGSTVHVIGFMLGSGAQSQARAIAQAGGGDYYDVQDADQLQSALISIGDGDQVSCCAGFMLLLLPLCALMLRRD